MIHRKASEIMNTSVVTFRAETDIYEAIRVFLKNRFSGAPVIDSEAKVIGILSELDCLRVLTGEAWDGLPEGKVGDYMTSNVASVDAETSVYDIVGIFLNKPYRRLPVLDGDGRLLGQISRRDVLGAVNNMHENPYLYGTKDQQLDLDDTGGVHSAMQRARDL